MELANRAALITGGKRIGAVVARTLAARGMDIALAYNRSREEADAAAADVRSHGRRAVAIHADLRRADDCAGLVDAAVKALGRLDVLLNMASVYTSAPFADTDERAWDAVVDVDLKASFLCVRAALPHLRQSGGGRIVNFTDWIAASGRPRYPGYLPYYVAKRGVIGLTEALALELAADRILVNAIAPGPMLPPTGTSDEEYEAVEKATPLGKWGGADEIARAVIFLLESDFTTGETIRVDGGRHLR
jgi:NAD(P)-dependent dehydrogenase (short-subunit alcohol dehydrogenase family)